VRLAGSRLAVGAYRVVIIHHWSDVDHFIILCVIAAILSCVTKWYIGVMPAASVIELLDIRMP